MRKNVKKNSLLILGIVVLLLFRACFICASLFFCSQLPRIIKLEQKIEKKDEKEIKEFVESYLDAICKGEFDEYCKKSKDTKEEIEAEYSFEINRHSQYFEEREVPVNKASKEKFKELRVKLLKNVKCEVSDAEIFRSDCLVYVDVQPILYDADKMNEDNKRMLDKATKSYYQKYPNSQVVHKSVLYNMLADMYLDYLEKFVDNPTYGEKETVVLSVNRNRFIGNSINPIDKVILKQTFIKEVN